MAPTRSKKCKSTESAMAVDAPHFAPPSQVASSKRSPLRSPTRSPIRKPAMGLTASQKQALIDNLQLEITERARKLRAQYMLQAQGLRARVEIRVNRIPVALRKVKMGELLSRHTLSLSTSTTSAEPSRSKLHSPSKNVLQESLYSTRQSPSPQKRGSDGLVHADKENDGVQHLLSKKRPLGPPVPPARTTSKLVPANTNVLSPRNTNSMTMHHAPIATSPQKSLMGRPASPLKPFAPAISGGASGLLSSMVEKAKSTRATAHTRKATGTSNASSGAGRGKRAAPAAPPSRNGRGRVSDTSEDSASSTGTTIVKKAAPAKKAPAKKTVMSTIKGIGSRKAAPKTAAASVAPAVGRTLRKRN